MHRSDDIHLPHPGHRQHPGPSHAQPQFHMDRVYPGRRPTSRGNFDTRSDVMDVGLRRDPHFSSSRSLDLSDRAASLDLDLRSPRVRESQGDFYTIPGTDARFYGAQRLSSISEPTEGSHPSEAIPMAVYRGNSSVADPFDRPAFTRQGPLAVTDSGTEEFIRGGQPRFGPDGYHGEWRRSGSEFTGMVTRMQPGYRSGPRSVGSLVERPRFGVREDRREREGRRDGRDRGDRGTGAGLYRDSVSDVDGYSMYRPDSLYGPGGGRDTSRLGSSRSRLVDDEDELWKDGVKVRLTGVMMTLRILAAILIMADSGLDWFFMLHLKTLSCGSQLQTPDSLAVMCGLEGKETLRRVLAVFVVMGTASATLQSISLFLETLRDCAVVHFRFFHPLVELYAVIFLEELPQALMAVLFTRSCSCSQDAPWEVVVPFGTLILGLLSAAARFLTSYRKLCGRHGCCNSWWRCCCCRELDLLVHATWRSCCCRCDVPLPLCCCTLRCDEGKGRVLCWCPGYPCRKVCTCKACREPDRYGVRVIVVVGMATQLALAVAMAIRLADAF